MRKDKKILLSLLALIAFALNSILCRLAMKNHHIDEIGFSILRLAGGAFILWLIVKHRGKVNKIGGTWLGASSLFLYVVTFSIAYTALTAATGALILFGAVQFTMFGYAYWAGERLTKLKLFGLILAASGVALLLLPGASQPSFFGFAMMAISGVAWAIYTIQGKGSSDPLSATAGNFILTLVPVFCLITICWSSFHADGIGVTLALTSGCVTSGIGYTIWYKVVPTLKTTTVSTIQLTVPLITELMSFLLLNENISSQFLLVSILILIGLMFVTYNQTS